MDFLSPTRDANVATRAVSRSFPGITQYHCVRVEGAAKFSSWPTATVPDLPASSCASASASAQKALGRRQKSASLATE